MTFSSLAIAAASAAGIVTAALIAATRADKPNTRPSSTIQTITFGFSFLVLFFLHGWLLPCTQHLVVDRIGRWSLIGIVDSMVLLAIFRIYRSPLMNQILVGAFLVTVITFLWKVLGLIHFQFVSPLTAFSEVWPF